MQNTCIFHGDIRDSRKYDTSRRKKGVLFINLLWKGLTQEISGHRGSKSWAPFGVYISSRFFENQPNEICSHFSEKASKGMFLKPEKLQNHINEGKGKEKKKERGEGNEEKKKAMVVLLVFIIATLEIVFGRKKTVRHKRSIWQ